MALFAELGIPVGVITALAVLLYRRRNKRIGLPPGPAPLPIIGNYLDIPSKDQWVTYEKWSHQYDSDLIHLNVLGTDIIVVNSATAAADLFEKKSALYSDRPPMPMINDLIGLKWHFGFMPHGDAWRVHRKIFNQEYNPAAVARFHDLELRWVHTLLQNLLSAPERLFDHIQHMASGMVLETTYGLQVQPSGQPDPFIAAAISAIEGLGAAGLFGSYLVDYIPSLKYIPSWLPFTGFKSRANHWRISVDIAATVPFGMVKNNIANNTAVPSITSALLKNVKSNEEETAIRQTGAAMFASGSAASVAALETFFLAMVLYPEVQAKAQEELDRVISGRLPSFSDEESLPYIGAILKEVLRWRPVVPLSFPHRLTTDDTYHGLHLPAGSVMVPNTWAILHNPKTYPDPHVFKPERFLSQSKLDVNVAFGYARRSCPGRHFAMAEMFLAIASILAVFDIDKQVDKDGVPIEPSGEYTQGLLSYPLPFKCTIRPRSIEAGNLIKVASNP